MGEDKKYLIQRSQLILLIMTLEDLTDLIMALRNNGKDKTLHEQSLRFLGLLAVMKKDLKDLREQNE